MIKFLQKREIVELQSVCEGLRKGQLIPILFNEMHFKFKPVTFSSEVQEFTFFSGLK